jgi:hypothetical protein
MRTITTTATITSDGRLKVDVPADLPPGPVEVVLVIQPRDSSVARDIRQLRGLGREIWEGTDAQAYVDTLRDEWQRP